MMNSNITFVPNRDCPPTMFQLDKKLTLYQLDKDSSESEVDEPVCRVKRVRTKKKHFLIGDRQQRNNRIIVKNHLLDLNEQLAKMGIISASIYLSYKEI
jgi:hypothetical protein